MLPAPGAPACWPRRGPCITTKRVLVGGLRGRRDVVHVGDVVGYGVQPGLDASTPVTAVLMGSKRPISLPFPQPALDGPLMAVERSWNLAFMASTMVWNCIPAFWLVTISVARSTLLPFWSAGAVDGDDGDLHLRGIAGGDGLGQARLEIDVLGLEVGRVQVGDVVGRRLLLGPQPLHGLVYGRTWRCRRRRCSSLRLRRPVGTRGYTPWTSEIGSVLPVPGVNGAVLPCSRLVIGTGRVQCERWATTRSVLLTDFSATPAAAGAATGRHRAW